MDGPNAAHKPLTVVVVGLGQMGHSHALAYHRSPGFQILGFVSKGQVNIPEELKGYCFFPDFESSLAQNPDVVSINSYSDTHAQYSIAAMESGAHVFVEKPLAPTVDEAKQVVATAQRTGRKLVVGYILRHHPSWVQFISEARKLGSPCVMRMNLNQRSTGEAWAVHKRIMQGVSPIVDCGVHYIDAMLQIAQSRPVQVRGMGARLSDEISPEQVNYGHLQVTFENGSVGWYEAGWGPMVSETAYSVKDIMGPQGSVSMVMDQGAGSADINSHTKVSEIRVHHIADKEDRCLTTGASLDHYELCAREQQYLADAIQGDWSLDGHMNDAVQSLAVVLAADASMREKRAINLDL